LRLVTALLGLGLYPVIIEGKLEAAVEFVLPLLGQLAGTDDKAALQVVTHDQFLDEQSSGLRFGVFGSNSSIRGFTPAIWHAM
jgi:hypothetical protein